MGVANKRPPITARASAAFRSSPGPPIAIGIMPTTIAAAVISTGRMRVWPASTAARNALLPLSCCSRANVTSRMEFAEATPTAMIAPISEGTLRVVVNTKNPSVPPALPDMKAAADLNGQRLAILDAGTEDELELMFASLKSHRIDALLITTNPFYEGRRQRLVALAERYSVPVLYPWREYSVLGGLISYGASFTDSYRHAGLYVGRILHGEKPADLPVMEPTKFELLINLKTAKALGIDVPTSVLLRADEVIE